MVFGHPCFGQEAIFFASFDKPSMRNHISSYWSSLQRAPAQNFGRFGVRLKLVQASLAGTTYKASRLITLAVIPHRTVYIIR